VRIQDFNATFLRGAQVQITGTSIEADKVGVALGLVLKDGSKMILTIQSADITQADGDWTEHFLDSNKPLH
jgi:hypothetical protein